MHSVLVIRLVWEVGTSWMTPSSRTNGGVPAEQGRRRRSGTGVAEKPRR